MSSVYIYIVAINKKRKIFAVWRRRQQCSNTKDVITLTFLRRSTGYSGTNKKLPYCVVNYPTVCQRKWIGEGASLHLNWGQGYELSQPQKEVKHEHAGGRDGMDLKHIRCNHSRFLQIMELHHWIREQIVSWDLINSQQGWWYTSLVPEPRGRCIPVTSRPPWST